MTPFLVNQMEKKIPHCCKSLKAIGQIVE